MTVVYSVEAIHPRNGIIDKFVGDGLMAF
jgi:adenylate cyclase